MDLPVPCMAEELERQCQRLDSLLEDEEYYATEDADPYVKLCGEVDVEDGCCMRGDMFPNTPQVF